MTDDNEPVTTAVSEKVCSEFNSNRHSKEVKNNFICKCSFTVFSGWVIYCFRLRKEKCVK